MDCPLHERRRAILVCTTCYNATICKDCKSGKHRSHPTMKPSEVSADIKRDFKQRMQQYIVLIANLESDKEDTASLKKNQELSQRVVERNINRQRKQLLDEVNSIADKLIDSYKEKVKDNCKILDSNTATLKRQIDTARRQKVELNAILNEPDDVSVVNKAAHLVLDNESDLNDLATVTTVTYKPGTIEIPQLEEMLGCSTTVTVEEPKMSQQYAAAQINLETSRSVHESSDCVGSLHRGRVAVDNTAISLSNLHTSASCQESVESRRVVKKPSDFAKAKMLSVFQCSNDLLSKSRAFEILPTGRTTSWINIVDKKKLKLMKQDGSSYEFIRHDRKIGGVCVTPENPDSMLLCSYDDMCIKQLACIKERAGLQLRMSDFLSTKPLQPQCVCRNQDEVHVTLVDSTALEITPASIRCVATFKNKNEIRRSEKDEFGDTIFVKPSRVKINKTGDILAVINRTDKKNTHLVLLNKDLTLKLRYLGNQLVLSRVRFQNSLYCPDTPYAINDVEFTDGDCLVVCELYSRCVQLLSEDCQTLMTVIGQGAVVPYSVAYYLGNLWVGYFDGAVKVYEFN